VEGSIIKAVQFHPSATVALVAGLSGVASLFQVDGKSNTKLLSVQFDRYPVRCARFVPSGEQFIIGLQHHRFFHTYDMMACQNVRVVPSQGLGITNTKDFTFTLYNLTKKDMLLFIHVRYRVHI
jgi:U3 small nucleolar RNA-associated protein 18